MASFFDDIFIIVVKCKVKHRTYYIYVFDRELYSRKMA